MSLNSQFPCVKQYFFLYSASFFFCSEERFLLHFFFFSLILISFSVLFLPFVFFFFRKTLISFRCFFSKLFFVFFIIVICHFYIQKRNYKNIYCFFCMSYVIYMSLFKFFHQNLLHHNFLHRIFSIRIRRNFYVVSDVLWYLFLFNNIYIFFQRHLRIIIFTCSKNRIDQYY